MLKKKVPEKGIVVKIPRDLAELVMLAIVEKKLGYYSPAEFVREATRNALRALGYLP